MEVQLFFHMSTFYCQALCRLNDVSILRICFYFSAFHTCHVITNSSTILLTVLCVAALFQILTQEDWNKVLYNGMASTSPVAALYFIALMTFGNYVLFNLLVAILVEGFQAEVRHRLPGRVR